VEIKRGLHSATVNLGSVVDQHPEISINRSVKSISPLTKHQDLLPPIFCVLLYWSIVLPFVVINHAYTACSHENGQSQAQTNNVSDRSNSNRWDRGVLKVECFFSVDCCQLHPTVLDWYILVQKNNRKTWRTKLFCGYNFQTISGAAVRLFGWDV